MFGQVFGRFLTQNGYLTKENLKKALEMQKSQRPRLGLIAVTEKYLTEKEAEQINRMQMQEDRRFGDIAVGYKFLTDNQVEHLLKLQGSPYHTFYQTMTQNGFLAEEDMKKAEAKFCVDMDLSPGAFEDIKSGEIDRILPHYVRQCNPLAAELSGVIMRAVIRLIDQGAVPGRGSEPEERKFDCLGAQNLVGDHNIFMGLASNGEKSLLAVAETFGKEAFGKMDEDAYDAVCEFINCINGMFASALSVKGVMVDMVPPGSYSSSRVCSSNKMLVFPIFFGDCEIEAVIATDAEVTIG